MAAAEKTSVEKISIALPGAMAAIIRSAVDSGEYASNSEKRCKTIHQASLLKRF
jgi:hypothetical protein